MDASMAYFCPKPGRALLRQASVTAPPQSHKSEERRAKPDSTHFGSWNKACPPRSYGVNPGTHKTPLPQPLIRDDAEGGH